MDPSIEQDRRYLQQMAEAAMDHKAAEILMANLPTVDWDAVATKQDIDARLEALQTSINARTDARIGRQTLVLMGVNVATLISLAGIAIGVAQMMR